VATSVSSSGPPASSARSVPVASAVPSGSSVLGASVPAPSVPAPTVPVTTVPPAPSASVQAAAIACRGTLRGAVEATLERPAGSTAAASSLWFDAAELARNGLAAPGMAGLSINCDDRAASVLVLLGAGTPAAALREGAGRYPVTPEGSPGTFTVLVAVVGDPRPWRVVSGDVELQAHDTRRVAGTVHARLGEPGGATAELTASFDHACSAGARCGR
jgi:hypothetical protein